MSRHDPRPPLQPQLEQLPHGDARLVHVQLREGPVRKVESDPLTAVHLVFLDQSQLGEAVLVERLLEVK